MKTRFLSAAGVLNLGLLLIPGLLRAQTISFTPLGKFLFPGATSTAAYGVNNAGDVVGGYLLPGEGYGHGFVRRADGTFEPVDFPGSKVFQTIATAINNEGVIAGWYDTEGDVVTHGFFLSNGVYTSFEYPTAQSTYIYGINDAGDFVGNYIMTGGDAYRGFASIGGQLSEVTVPGSTYAEPHDINNHGDIVGWANGVTASYGFRLKNNGSNRFPITPSNQTSTNLLGANDVKESVGTQNGAFEALYYGGGDLFVTYNYPGLTYNSFTGINRRGLICGSGYDAAASVNYGYLIRRVIAEADATPPKLPGTHSLTPFTLRQEREVIQIKDGKHFCNSEYSLPQ